jgi:glycosyltransferase involved in cell wall biosynthesis
MNRGRCNIGVLTSPIETAGILPLSNLINIISKISDNICLITGNAAYRHFKDNPGIVVHDASLSRSNFFLLRILKYLSLQLRILLLIVKTRKTTDTWIFMFGAESQILPVFGLKLMKKNVILFFTGSSFETQKHQRDNFLPILNIIYIITCILADSIIVYSKRNIEEYGLTKWADKISFFQEHMVDSSLFFKKKGYRDRENIIGYIGRLSKEKGIINFIDTIPLLCQDLPDYSFLIGGDGPLRNEIEYKLTMHGIHDIVRMSGWIGHEKLPEYLNELKLLVVPSFTEGLPNIMLESFACGTPVLATQVGAIPDIISDGKTGFLMENNTPESIKSNIIRALENDNINQIVANSEYYVLNNFILEKKVECLKHIIKKTITK